MKMLADLFHERFCFSRLKMLALLLLNYDSLQ